MSTSAPQNSEKLPANQTEDKQPDTSLSTFTNSTTENSTKDGKDRSTRKTTELPPTESTKPTTFILPGSKPPCLVTLPDNLTQDQLLSFTAFKNWLSSLQNSLALQSDPSHDFHNDPFELLQIDVQSADWFGGDHYWRSGPKLGFVKLQADIKSSSQWLPGAVFLRGGSVGMLVSSSIP